MKQKIIALMMLLMAATLLLAGCQKTEPIAQVKDTSKDAATTTTTTATTDVTQGISDVQNLTTLDDASLDQNLGAAGKALASW